MLRRVEVYRGQRDYPIEIGGVSRRLPIVQVDEGVWIASNAEVILGDVEFISAAARLISEKVSRFSPEIIVTAESKAIAFAYEAAKLLGHRKFVIARKSVKSYMRDYLVEEVRSITTSGKQFLVLPREETERIRGRRVCVLDDVVSTGGTLKGLERLVEGAGGRIVCRAAIWVEGPWYRGDLIYL
ncbi:MAG: phosphoribosyltransferase, partial [Thaumarchaeota archaeon]|nr:phosphoribosyltransferase [Nitrososphaerota archaeon]